MRIEAPAERRAILNYVQSQLSQSVEKKWCFENFKQFRMERTSIQLEGEFGYFWSDRQHVTGSLLPQDAGDCLVKCFTSKPL